MSKAKSTLRRPLAVLLASLGCTALVLPMLAADGASPARAPSTMVNLIQRLAERGAINAEDAAELTKLAEADAADARVQAALATLAAAQADAAKARAEAAAAELAALKKAQGQTTNAAAASLATVAPAPMTPPTPGFPVETAKTAGSAVEVAGSVAAAPAAVAQSAVAPAPADDDVHVTYVPEVVKAQLREEIKNEVMQQAKDEHWAAPRSFPDWVSRFTFFGDFRMRYEGIYNHQSNDTNGSYTNFNAINTGSPYDISTSNTTNPPIYNVDKDRNRVRLRARLGAVVDLGDGFTSNFRIATGENNSPVSENQSFGAAGSGQGGNFSKYSLWLDRAYLKYQSNNDLARAFTVTLGRFENPFLATSIIWADDLGFDGAVMTIPAQLHFGGEISNAVKPYFVVGAFPVFNTDLNFGTNQAVKTASNDKWLEAAQGGLELKLGRDFKLKLGAAYYMFTKVSGKLSTSQIAYTSSDVFDTDARRPAFAQKGNTYIKLRDITADSSNSYGNSNQWQYFGLATPFNDIAIDARLDYNHFEPFQVSLYGEVIRNRAFNRNKIIARGNVNNLGSSFGTFEGGNQAWIIGTKLGNAVLQNRWDWNVGLSYRYVESDAVIDGFCDSDFGGGGTNLKGVTFAANLALSRRVFLGAKWMGATQAQGAEFKNDILQIDVNAKF